MKTEAKELFATLKGCFQQTTLILDQLKSELMNDSTEELVDTIYALRESYKYADETRKDIEKLRKDAARIGVIRCDEMMINNPQSSDIRIKTDYCSGTPKETATFNYPSRRQKDPERFDTLMAALGIPQSVYTQELVRIHWPEFQSYCQGLIDEGKETPNGIDPMDSNPVYDFAIRKLKEIDSVTTERQAIQDEKEVNYVPTKEDSEVPF